ncbi:MAG: PaaI family thioesterase [Anaerolineae bacterium]
MLDKPIQHYYPDEISMCFGCGRNNPHGLHLQSYWQGDEAVCHFLPQPYHTAYPGIVYGGILASLIDCHSISTGVVALHNADGQPLTDGMRFACVTGQLNVRYLKPTPLENELVLRAHVKELGPRKALVVCTLSVNGIETVTGEVLAVRVENNSSAHGHR